MRPAVALLALLAPAVAAAQPSRQAPAPPAPVYLQQPPPPARDGELRMIGTGAALGVLGAAAWLDATDHRDPASGTLVVLGGVFGGGVTGWLVADKLDVGPGGAEMAIGGLGLGVINAALLLEPLDDDGDLDSEQVLATLLAGGAIGAGAGLALGEGLDLTEGQAVFAQNLALLGAGTTALTIGLTADEESDLGAGSLVAIAIGLDAGLVAGLVAAPKIRWSHGRARFVEAATIAGAFGGLFAGGLVANEDTGNDPRLAVGAVLGGMWAGFAGGVLITRDWAPDPRYLTPRGVTLAPMLGDHPGVVASGRF